MTHPTLEKARLHAQKMNGQCLSMQYVNNKTKLEWKCSNPEHPFWLATSDNVLNKGSWCPLCGGKTPKSSKEGLEIAQKHAIKMNGQCLSTEYVSRQKNLTWLCHMGHQWEATSDNVVYKNSWCKVCADIAQQDKKDHQGLKKAQDYATSRGGQCLSTVYINQNFPLAWKCSNPEHPSWLANAKISLTNSWCKLCYHQSLKKS